MGTFDGLRVGLSALHAQRRAIEVAGQNVANVNTEGYSRQRVEMVADAGPVRPALFGRYEGTGLGVRSVDVTRLRDQFLEARARDEHATRAYLGRIQTSLRRIELAFAEPSDTGLAAQLADFWAGWDDVGLHPGDEAARSQLLERAATLTASFRQLDTSLGELGEASVEQLRSLTAEVNAVARRIAELNGSIASAGSAGLPTNDLEDQRDTLVLQLARQAGATARPGATDGALDVFLGGMAIVRGAAVEEVVVAGGTGPGDPVRVAFADDGLEATIRGEALALVETANLLVPGQQAALRDVALRLLEDVNDLHHTGVDRNGQPGGAFFTMGANGLEVDAALDADGIAASSPGTLDGEVARRMAELDGADTVYRELVVRLGVNAQTANRRVEVQDSIVRQLDTAREAEAGVDLDEEMTNLVAFQHAYDAAARVIGTVDEMLETLLRMAA